MTVRVGIIQMELRKDEEAMYLVTAKEMQQMDQATIQEIGIPGRILMENAGAGAFRFMCRLFPDLSDSKVAVIAGRGNNGGDGFVIARHLFQKGVVVKVYLLMDFIYAEAFSPAMSPLFRAKPKVLPDRVKG